MMPSCSSSSRSSMVKEAYTCFPNVESYGTLVVGLVTIDSEYISVLREGYSM